MLSDAFNPSRFKDSFAVSGDDVLSRPDQLLAAYFSSSTIGLCILDSQLRYLAVNTKLAEINGVPASEHLGKTVRQVLGDFANVIEPRLQQVLTTGERISFEAASRLPSATEAGQWLIQYVPIGDGSGVVNGVGAVVVETTDRKKIEDLLCRLTGSHNSHKRLQVLADLASLLASNTDIQLAFPWISATVRRIFSHEYGALLWIDPNSGSLALQSEDFPLGKGLTRGVQIEGDSPPALALEQKLALIFSREQLQKFTAEIARRYLEEGLRSLCCIPVWLRDRTFGVLVLGSTRMGAFQPDDLKYLEQVAAQMSRALESQQPVTKASPFRPTQQSDLLASDQTLDAVNRKYIVETLCKTGGVLSGPNGAAKRLGLKRTTLISRMQRLGINPRDFRGSARHSPR